MRLIDINGKLKYKNCRAYRIDWNQKERSIIQFKVKKFLEPFWKNHVVFSEFPVFGTRLKIDIFNATKNIAVEIDGNQHNEFNKFFHRNRLGYLNSLKRDNKKEKFLELNNIKLARVLENEINDISVEYFKEMFGIEL